MGFALVDEFASAVEIHFLDTSGTAIIECSFLADMEIVYFHNAGIVVVIASGCVGQSDVVSFDGSARIDDEPAGLYKSEGMLVRYHDFPSVNHIEFKTVLDGHVVPVGFPFAFNDDDGRIVTLHAVLADLVFIWIAFGDFVGFSVLKIGIRLYFFGV